VIATGKEKCFCPSQGYSQLSSDKTKQVCALNSHLAAFTNQENLLFCKKKVLGEKKMHHKSKSSSKPMHIAGVQMRAVILFLVKKGFLTYSKQGTMGTALFILLALSSALYATKFTLQFPALAC